MKEDGFIQIKSCVPACNHDFSKADDKYLGTVQGVFTDGTFFEAEKWKNDELGFVCISFFFEEQIDPNEAIDLGEENDRRNEAETVELEHDSPGVIGVDYGGFLNAGMTIRKDVKESFMLVQAYTDYLKDMGVVKFLGEFENTTLLHLYDEKGQHIVEADIIMVEQGELVAASPLTFTPVQEKQAPEHWGIILH